MGNKNIRKSLHLLILLVFISAAYAAPHTWKSVQVGGGGYVTGMVFHPAQQNLMYARTDMGGAYRWDNANTKWIPITDMLVRSNSDYMGILAMALDPSDVNKVYMLCGKYTQSWAGNGAVLVSNNQGASWTINSVPFKVGGNEVGRGAGERLAVDPNLGSILYAGTSGDYPSGLYKSTNSGTSFASVASFPQTGVINFIQFIKSSGTTGNATQTIYVAAGVNGSSLYKTTNGGTSWTLVPGQPAGQQATRCSLSGNTMYIVYSTNNGPNNGSGTGSVQKLDITTDTFTNITPSGSTNFGGISVDQQNANNVVVTTLFAWQTNDPLYYSTNGGTSWTNKSTQATYVRTTSPYTSASNPHWATDIQIDPYNSNIAIWNTGYGVWRCTNLQSASVTWNFNDVDLEETVPLQIISPPSGANLLSAMGDVDGFRHDNLDVSPPQGRYNPRKGTTLSIAFAESVPLKIVKGYNASPYGAYSIDGGTAWTDFASFPAGTTGGGSKAIAISANGNNIVWSPAGAAVSYSTNNGGSWTASAGSPPAGFSPVADRVNSNKFYIYDGVNGRMWVSTNGGAAFAQGATGLPVVPSWAPADGVCASVPGNEGHLFITTEAGGLYRSTDSGATATKVNSVTAAYRVGFGMPLSTYPTIFLHGIVGGVTGFFMSTDQGATWTQINDANHQYGYVHQIIGDPRVYGRCYVSAEGRGIVYGDLAGTPTPTFTSTYTITPGGPTFTSTYTATYTNTATSTPTPPPFKLIYDGDTAGYTMADGVPSGTGTWAESPLGVTGDGLLMTYTAPAYWQQVQWNFPAANTAIAGNTNIVFNIKANSGTVSALRVTFGWEYGHFLIDPYIVGGGSVDGTWKTVSIPIVDVLSNTHTAVNYITFINNSNSDYSIIMDNLRFEGAAAATNTYTYTTTATYTQTPTRTNTQTSTNTPASTNTFTYTNTNTQVPTVPSTNTPTRTNTIAPTSTFTVASTNTNTFTNTGTNTATNTNTATSTRTFTSTYTDTYTPSETITSGGPTLTFTYTYTATNTPVPCACGVTYGKTDITGMSGASIYNSITANPIHIAKDTTIESLGVHVAATTGGSLKMALYTNEGFGPESLIVSSGESPSVVGWNTVDIPDTVLAAGYYWITINTAAGITVSGINGMSNSELYTGFVAVTDAMPATFPTSGTSAGSGIYALTANACPASCDTPTSTPTPVLPCVCSEQMGLRYIPTATGIDLTGWMVSNSYTPDHTGIATGANVYVYSGSGQVNVAIYSNDNSTGDNMPSVLLAQSGPQAVIAGWNAITFPSIHLTAGTVYWISMIQSPGLTLTRDMGGTYDCMVHELDFGSFPGVLPWPYTYDASNWAFNIEVCPDVCDTPTYTPTSTNTSTYTTAATSTNTATYTYTETSTVAATSTNTSGIPTPTFTNTTAGVCVMDNGEDGDNTNLFGGYWYTYAAGNGVSIVPDTTANGGTFTMTAGGNGGSSYAINFTGTVGTEAPDYPSIGVGGQLNPMAGAPPDGTGQVTDISGCTGVRFYTKGDGKNYHIKIPYTDVNDVSLTGYNDYRYDFAAPASWTLVDVPFTLFAQATGWGTAFPRTTVLQNAKALQFQTSFYAPAGTVTAELWIDDIELYGCVSACPGVMAATPTETATTGIDTPTHTYTHTNTVTTPVFTATHTRTHTATNTLYLYTSTNTPVNTATFTYTATYTPTGTNTQTPVFTPANTFTHTYTATETATEIFTSTPTPVATKAELEITDQIAYPNPVNPKKDGGVLVKFTATRNYEEQHLLLYTAALRLIREKSYKGNFAAGEGYIGLAVKEIDSLANGTYYYVILLKDDKGKTVKGKVGKIVVLK